MRTITAGRALRAGAGAALAGTLMVGAAAAPAFAASDQLWIDVPYEAVLTVAPENGEAETRTLELGLSHDNAGYRVTDGRLTVDVSELTGVADVTWPENCAPSGTTAVCSVPVVPVTATPQIRLGIRAAAGAEAGAAGRITYQAKATTTAWGGTIVAPQGYETTVRLASGPDLAMERPGTFEGVRPGDTVTVPFSVVNNGNEAADGVQVTLHVSRGLLLDEIAPQCTSEPLGDEPVKALTRVDCAFDEVVAPGASFTLPKPLTATVAPFALNERLDVGVQPGGGVEDLSPEDNGGQATVRAVNTADFAVRGAKVTGAAGETVPMNLTFRNKGPAWVANLGSGEPVAAVDLIVPEGATVMSAPENCDPRTLDGGWTADRVGAPRYLCDVPMVVAEDQKLTYAFQLRVDTVVAGATGDVTLRAPWGDKPLAFDPNPKNDTGKVVLNAPVPAE
ncbi:hypothetical protein [Streptomyces sp. NPDC047928]|uniref:hypothetical protein n=1 Tax=unclassified Streptomyces TaxID=2593676 RepID=UPI003722FB2F